LNEADHGRIVFGPSHCKEDLSHLQ